MCHLPSAGTLSGAPKIRAMVIIEELEKVRRWALLGECGSRLCRIFLRGDMDFRITDPHADQEVARGVYFCMAGAEIVADSVPEKEYQECLQQSDGACMNTSEGENL